MNGPAHARQIVTREFARVLPPERLEELKLMVSELVTRAVVHGAYGTMTRSRSTCVSTPPCDAK
jgi:anti-sigma regulatory factor (Ser/Thr protein kinase)